MTPNLSATPADLSEAAIEDLCIQIMNATNDRGLKVSLMPKSLIVPTSLVFEAQRILKSTGQSGTANNDLNALKSMGVFPQGPRPTTTWPTLTPGSSGPMRRGA